MNDIPKRPLGKTGDEVSMLGLGGGGMGRNPQIRGASDRPAVRDLARQIIRRALDEGINYFDTCNGYGESESILGEVAAERRGEMFLATKCHRPGVSGDELRRELEQSLRRLRTDRLDLWQIHNLTAMEQVDLIFQKDHAIDVFRAAKEEGMTRFIGITSHASAGVLERVLERCEEEGVEMDCVLMSMNAMDDLGGGHGRRLLERYGDDGRLGFIAMKVFGSDGAPLLKETGLAAAAALRFVWSSPVATAVVGTHSIKDLDENIRAARNFTPMSNEERVRLGRRIEKPTASLWQISA